MLTESRHRVRAVLVCLAASGMLMSLGLTPVAAGSDYEIDIQGTLEISGATSSGTPIATTSEQEVNYRIIFQYQEPGQEKDPQGLSPLDRVAQVADGAFEIQGLRGNKVYRVTVERVIFSADVPGGVTRELIPLDIPPDFFEQTPVPAPVVVELAIMSPDRIDTTGRALSFMYDGKDVMLAAVTEAPPVS